MVRNFSAYVCAFVGMMLTNAASFAQPAPDGSGPLVRASLIADADGVVPGRPFTLGVVFDVKPDWHVYWTNPGDAGLPTQIDWKLPAGLTAGPIRFPLPHTFTQPGDVVGYGYFKRVLLTTIVTPASDLSPGTTLDVGASAKWLVCNEVCVPGKAKLSLSLPVVSSASTANAELFGRVESEVPLDATSGKAAGFDVLSAAYDSAASVTTLRVRFDPAERVTSVEFFPGPSDAAEIRHVVTELANNVCLLRLPVKFESAADAEAKLFGLVVWTNQAGERKGAKVVVPIK